ncbi:MAG: hypothetical protein RR505_12150, partial [Raoultibacter sp.]
DQQTVFDDSQAAREQSYLDAETARGASYDAAEANRAESFTANETKRDETSEVAVKRANDAADKVNQAIAGELDPYVRTALDEMKDKPGGIVGYEKYEDERFTPDEVTIITYTDDTGKHIKAALGSSADGTTISETIDPDTNEKTFSVAEPVMSRVEGLETSLTESDKRITTVEDAIAVLKEDMGVIDDSLFRATGVR